MSVIIERYAAVDLCKPLAVKPLGDVLSTGDRNAHRFHVRLMQDGQQVTIIGSVQGMLIRPDGSAVVLPGSVDETGAAAVQLTGACYAIPGWIQLFVRVIDAAAQTKTTVYACQMLVNKGTSELLAEASAAAPDLADVLAQLERVNQAAARAEAAADRLETMLNMIPTVQKDDQGDIVIAVHT